MIMYDLEELKDVNIQDIDTQEDFIDFTRGLSKDYDSYLVVALNCRYNGASGYKIVYNKQDCFYRSYNCSQYVVNRTKKGKTLILKEFHHDKPMGHYTVIIGLTDSELEKLNNMSFENIINLAKSKI